MAAYSLVIGRLFARVGYDILCTMTGSGRNITWHTILCIVVNLFGVFFAKVIEALFLAAGGFDGLV